MTRALNLEKYQMTRNSEMRVGDIMRQLGYERFRTRIGGKRSYVWSKDSSGDVIPIQKPRAVKDEEYRT
jgi:dissimilatory sulfite reductase (desulfoviridin) alpha/beta subunit